MKNFLYDCMKHEKAKSHMGAYKTWRTYGFQPRVDCLMSQARREEIQRHNEEVDEATDVSTKEQLSVIFRMDIGESVIERQLGFIDVSCDRTATAISSVVKGWDDETLSKVTGLLGYLNGFLFCFLVLVFHRILEQSSILYSILQDKDTDFHYLVSRIERFKAFVASLRNDTEYCQVYDLAVEKVGPPVTRYDQRHNYKQMYFEILDTIVTMLTERFQDMEHFDLVNPRVFKMWKGEVPSEKINLLKEVYGHMFDIPMLVSQLCFIYRDKDFHRDSCDELLKYIYQFHLQSSIPEVVKLLKINGVLSITSASVERSFSCSKRVKIYLRNTMSQGRFSSLCRISIHKDILSEKEDANTLHDEVVKKFIEKLRRLAFLYK
ncbi:uncharacterized protein LOC124458112 [Xenia sp. Carnegie-2017]|uniref:uncharacterized protein LOC124458112 n=1 Tax=Xenia sp. Carnegie-2017 TaxID=2897299 RepID=UPI001F03C739|nr:uncharacterized protein LOC124458112 [Xenia sp. Carnegie-2017]